MPATLPFILLSRCCGDEHPPELMLQPLRVPTAQGKAKPQHIIQMWHQLHDLLLAEWRPPLVRMWMWGPPLTRTGMKVDANTAQSCAAIPPMNTRVLFVHKLLVLF